MTWYGPHPRLRDADDPADPVWRWFILNGPHGERFSWPRDLVLLREFIAEHTDEDSGCRPAQSAAPMIPGALRLCGQHQIAQGGV
jgi:hypothetical protein